MTKAFGLLVIAVAASLTASATENLVANGSFDQHVAYWGLRDPDGGDAMAWDSEDANSDPSSGSMALAEDGTTNLVWSVQCIPVLGGNEYRFGGVRKIESGSGSTQILLQQYEGLYCTTGFISNFNTVSPLVGVWTTVDELAGLDPAARTVLLAGWFNNSSGGAAIAKFDEFFLSSDTVIFFDHFEYGDLFRWDHIAP